MHNCKETKEQLTEIALDEGVLPSEVSRCDECRSEFEALNATLRVTARLRQTVGPPESYWPGYHARLRQRLTQEFPAKAQRSKEKLVPVFASSFAPLRLGVRTALTFFKSSVPVPIPLAIAAIILFSVLGVVAFRSTPPQNPIIVHVPVEVPVVQEKTVTQVVYRDRRRNSKLSRRAGVAATSETTFARSQKPRNEDLPINLTGFKPTEEIKLTVIKGGIPNEQ